MIVKLSFVKQVYSRYQADPPASVHCSGYVVLFYASEDVSKCPRKQLLQFDPAARPAQMRFKSYSGEVRSSFILGEDRENIPEMRNYDVSSISNYLLLPSAQGQN